MRSRRLFLGSGLGAAGLAFAYYSHWTSRLVRGFIDETKRDIAPAQKRPTPQQWPDDRITAAWIGHSTVLINFLGVRILTDPVMFPRIGADLVLGTVGPKRLVEPALEIPELPPIDLVLLSHAHMDHLDLPTLKSIRRGPQVVTAKATGDILESTGLKQVHELGWGERTRLKTRNGILDVEAFQVRHWGARWRRDTFRGYNGYIVSREGKSILFGGDTAMCDTFRDLRSKGPFELAIMPIGAYDPWIHSHCNPEQALQMADAAGGRHFLPIHHCTFTLGREGQHAPIRRLESHLEQESGRLALREIGETFQVA